MGFTTNLSKRTTISNNLDNNGNRNNNSVGGEGWGMGFFLVFFPQQNEFTSSSSLKPHAVSTILKRSSSTHIMSKAQSTFWICALLFFVTFLLFTVSTFEPSKSPHHYYRRHLSETFRAKKHEKETFGALQKMGTLYTRGTKSMNELVICHVTEHLTLPELKMFLRVFFRSGLLSRSDLVFVLDSFVTLDDFDHVIRDESKMFFEVVHRFESELRNGSNVGDFKASFDVAHYLKHGQKGGDTIWGRKNRSGSGLSSSSNSSLGSKLTRASYGSVVGFGVGELDPENSLSGFLDHVPMSLRRWATYPMLLGRVRRNFKHVMLVDTNEVLVLGDPLKQVRTLSPESVFLSSSSPTKHNHKTHQKTVNPAVIVGGARGVRRLSATMLNEIVRATSKNNKRKSPITESLLLSRLMSNEFVMKNVRLIDSGESIPEASSLNGMAIANNNTMVRRGSSNLDIELMNHICSFELEALVYTDCGKVKVQPLEHIVFI